METSNGKVQNGNSKLHFEAGQDPRELIPQLCNHFYHLGWASGTGGGLSIRVGGRIYCAPSGVQKERIESADIFVLDEQAQILERPQNSQLKCSECLSLFMVPFRVRQAGCCIHSHSVNANLITALCHHQQAKNNSGNKLEFRISQQEMIKGIKRGASQENLEYYDTLIVPIIENESHERDLAGAMEATVKEYEDSNAVLVRNHGLYVWGANWQQAKSQAECYDYLFKLAIEAAKLGLPMML